MGRVEWIVVMLSDVLEMILGRSSKQMSRAVGRSRILVAASVRMVIIDI